MEMHRQEEDRGCKKLFEEIGKSTEKESKMVLHKGNCNKVVCNNDAYVNDVRRV
jgi:hypothetical protein